MDPFSVTKNEIKNDKSLTLKGEKPKKVFQEIE